MMLYRLTYYKHVFHRSDNALYTLDRLMSLAWADLAQMVTVGTRLLISYCSITRGFNISL